MKAKNVLLLLLIAITVTPSYGQRKKIVYDAKVRLLNGSLEKGYLIALHDSSIQIQLKVRPPKDTLFTIDRIKIISLRNRSSMGIGLLAGMGTGLVIGAAITPTPKAECSDPFCTDAISDMDNNLWGVGRALLGMAVGGAVGIGLGSVYKEFVIHGDIGLYQNMIDSLPSTQIKKLRMTNEGAKLN